MTEPVALPFWLAVLVLAFAAWAAYEHLLAPALRWMLAHPANRVIDQLSTRLRIGIRPFQRTRRQALVHRLMTDPKVQEAAERHAREKGVPVEKALKRVEAYAREHLRGIWAATLTPFTPELRLDEAGWRRNLRHWYRDLGIDGLFVNGKQGEFYAMSLAERKLTAEAALAEGAGGVMVSCSDQSLDTVLELARHAQAIGADYIVVHTPLLYFGAHTSDTLFDYYRRISEAVEIGVVLWNQPPDCGYLLEPEVCLRIAELPNVVAIKYSVPRETYAPLSRMAGEKLIVSTSSEEAWLDNIVELGWRVYLCSTPPFLLQTAEPDGFRLTDRRVDAEQYESWVFQALRRDAALVVQVGTQPPELSAEVIGWSDYRSSTARHFTRLRVNGGGGPTFEIPLVCPADWDIVDVAPFRGDAATVIAGHSLRPALEVPIRMGWD